MMKARLLASTAGALFAALLVAPAGFAQKPSAPQPAPNLSTEQIDQLLAPIALYPDPLLSQVLMAATYPVEVVEADRWRQDPANTRLSGDALGSALDQQAWDPSVKSLVAYPQILAMMDGDLDWTESLGEAFIADQATVMDEIQKLRHQAQANGKLGSNAEESVSDQDGDIDIEPAGQSTVYVPEYDPTVVYGPWPYPDYPPYYFPSYFSDCEMGDFGYCWVEWPIFVPLWGWDHWDWRGHRIDIDRDRFSRIDHGRPPAGGGVWEHDPSHRHGVPYQIPSVGGRFGGPSGSPGEQRQYRGYGAGAPSATGPGPNVPPSMESYGRGADARIDAARGQASRASPPSYSPRGGGFPGGGIPHGGGGVRGGGGRR